MVLGRGKMLSNYEIDATGATGKWPDTTHYWAIVPAGKVWRVVSAAVYRAVSSTCNWYINDGTNDCIINEVGAGTSVAAADLSKTQNLVLSAGWALRTTLGTGQNASSYGFCVVEEFSI